MPREEDARHRNEQMVAELVQDGAVMADSPIERAFRTVLRHWFLPDAGPDEVYRDMAVVTHRDSGGVPVSSSSRPAIMARMLGQLELRRGHRVLEVGAGTGYNAALLAQLVGPEGSVITVDVDPEICAAAERHLQMAGVPNVSVVVGDGWAGVRASGPFDRIEATVGVWDLSTDWVRQLEVEGMLVAPLWLRTGLQASVGFKKLNGGLEAVSIEPCGFMRLSGPGAGDPGYEQIGGWTVSFDEADAARAGLLDQLLQTEPYIEPAPPLAPGWFTPIGLREPDAVSLFMVAPEGPVVCCGVLDAAAPALAVVASDPRLGNTVQAFGGDQARRRLLRFIDTEAPIEIKNLSIKAIPAGMPVNEYRALATLTRPNFTFVVCDN
jgi:protein-L-isoaspartate(D-aspartate) O-methyltransferase